MAAAIVDSKQDLFMTLDNVANKAANNAADNAANNAANNAA